MIAHLNGELTHIGADHVVIDVGGVGYKVFVPLAVSTSLPKPGNNIRLLITTIVREDSFSLYGFREESEQTIFEWLLAVSGVGPKAAMNILGTLSVNDIVGAVSRDVPQELSRVQGIGIKTAQRIVIDLREKVTTLVWAQAGERAASPTARALDDAVEGLVALGYSRNDARSAADEALRSLGGEAESGEVVRAALKLLSKG